MVAHHTAALVQQRLRRTLYEHVGGARPRALRRATRTGEVMLSLVEGVQQLEIYFGQYLPQLFVAALTPVLIFAFVAFLDLPVALVLLVAALVTLLAPDPVAPLGQPGQPRPQPGLRARSAPSSSTPCRDWPR